MDYVEDFVNKNLENDRLPLPKVYSFLDTRFRISIRMFQWDVKLKLLPEPDVEEWKNKYYTKKLAIETLQKARIIAKFKEYKGIGIDTIRKIFWNYKDQSQALIDELLNDIEAYPAFYQDDQYADTLFDRQNNMIMRRICEDLEQGIELSKLNAADIEGEIKAKYKIERE